MYESTQNIVGYWKPTTTSPPHETWFKYTPYIAEFWSTLSCVGFFIVSGIGFVYGNPANKLIYGAVSLCGLASVLSHVTVKRSMLFFDYFGVISNVVAVGISFNSLKYALFNTNLIYAAAFTAGCGALDVYNKYHANKKYVFVHSLWHLAVAYMMSHFIY